MNNDVELEEREKLIALELGELSKIVSMNPSLE